MKKIIFFSLYLFSICCYSQNQTTAYSREYEFKEGIYLTIEDFFNNNPIEKKLIVSAVPKTDVDFMKQVVENKYMMYKDSTGKEIKIETSTIWGYCQNRSIYINYNKSFNRLNVIGTLCHFTATITNYINYTDPMYTMGMNNTYDEVRQFVLDTQINKVYAFNVGNMELILKNDDALFEEFSKIKKRKKGDAIFLYMRKYNEKRPLYLKAD